MDLRFELAADVTLVHSRLRLVRNPASAAGEPLILDGRELELLGISLNEKPLSDAQYDRKPDCLIIPDAGDRPVVEITTRISPSSNTALEGLYQSGNLLCTQCEAHGFSRITYFLDRPDVMARYRVTLSADRALYPVLLANGNPTANGTEENDRHWVTWEDPFPKPCYLFALVAGNLALIEDEFVTASGRTVSLRIYVEPENKARCGHAMASLKQAMRWDEEAYGREYDLNIFMIVAVGSFNMGAMENKGLNIFNARYVIADPETATDDDYEAIRDIIGHEYFHNWTGNRITCRDWFQLSVKESLTVFREQQFSASSGSAAIARLRQARLIRDQQFPEDAGPTAHPVRPDSYLEVNNLYTLTVYEKGAEIIRMIHTLLGEERFRAGMERYFATYDGQAVTVEDFLASMEEAGGQDLGQFRLWYSQAGTPTVTIESHYDRQTQELRLELAQTCNATPGQPNKHPLLIPLRTALVGVNGELFQEQVIELVQSAEERVFKQVPEGTLPSVLRDFSAPVHIKYELSDLDLRHLVLHSADAFSRWDAVRRLYLRHLKAAVDSGNALGASIDVSGLSSMLMELLADWDKDPSLLAELLQLPNEHVLAEQFESVDVDVIVKAWSMLRRSIAISLYERLYGIYESDRDDAPYCFDPQSVGKRRLRNTCLHWLLDSDHIDARDLAQCQYKRSNNMTDTYAALLALNDHDCLQRDEAIRHFQERWRSQPLVLDKWLTLQATTRLSSSVEGVQTIVQGADFDHRNPNRVRALIGAFAHRNMTGFHRADGAGYRLVMDAIQRLDPLNAQSAARLASAFTRWRHFKGSRGHLMRHCLEQLHAIPTLSADVSEIVSKSLNSG